MVLPDKRVENLPMQYCAARTAFEPEKSASRWVVISRTSYSHLELSVGPGQAYLSKQVGTNRILREDWGRVAKCNWCTAPLPC